MKKFLPIALFATLATFSIVPAAVHAQETAAVAVAGKMLYGANGQRIAAVYHVNEDGTAQVIIDGKLYNVPASTLSNANGKITSTLTKREVVRSR
jgi:hypothetical protein